MSLTKQTNPKNLTSDQDLEDMITRAMKKVGGKKENDLCRYLPVRAGGYMHHFTLRKMKTEDPRDLATMIQRYILDTDVPVTVAPKPRAPRGTRKRRDQIAFSKTDMERMLNLARMAGDKEMVRKLTPKKDLRTIKRELIASIRHNHVDAELWNSYCEAVSTQGSTGEGQTSGAYTQAALQGAGLNGTPNANADVVTTTTLSSTLAR